MFATALQSRINALTTDFVNRDDPAQRAVIANDRQKALDDMTHLNSVIEADKKAIADFEEEARRAAVPGREGRPLVSGHGPESHGARADCPRAVATRGDRAN